MARLESARIAYFTSRGMENVKHEGPEGELLVPEASSIKNDGTPEYLKEIQLERVPPQDPSPAAVGEFLITHPISCVTQPGLDLAVLLIDEIDEEVGHVRAITINSPARPTLRELFTALGEDDPQDQAWKDLGPLLDLPLGRGGDILSNNMVDGIRWLHSLREVPEAREVAPSVWLGGHVGSISPEEITQATVRPVLGYAGWSRAQLAVELQRGVWVRARAATPQTARLLCLPPAPYGAPLLRGKATEAKQPPSPFLERGEVGEWQVAVWRSALRAAGALSLADFPRGPKADVSLRDLVEKHYRRQFEELTGKSSVRRVDPSGR